MLIFMLLFSVVIILLFQYFTYRYNFRKKLAHIKGSKGWFLFGNAIDFMKSSEILNTVSKYYHENGPLFKAFFGPLHAQIYVLDPELLEVVLNSRKLINKSAEYSFFNKWLGNGLITAPEPIWKVHRKLMTPAFHFKLVEAFTEQLDKPYQVLEKKIEETQGGDIEVYDLLNLYTLDIVSETSMGYEINAQGQKQSPVVQSTKELSRIMSERGFSALSRIDFLYKFTQNFKSEEEYCKVIHTITDNVIEKRKENFGTKKKSNENDNFGIKTRKAFLDTMLEYQKEFDISDTELRCEVNTIMFAGQDTTGSGLTFILYCLAKHPEIQKKLYDEVIDLFGNKPATDLSSSELNSCKYLDMVIKETLRLYPPVPIIARKVTEDFQMGNIFIPKGVSLAMAPYMTHRIPKYFKNPENFDPEHFNEENANNRHPYSYIPFSAGPRNCIGQRFAMQTMKTTIVNLIRTFEIQTDNKDMQVFLEITLKPKNGCHLKFKKRYL